MLSKKRVKNRRFEYHPRFYDPSKEEELKRRMRIKRKPKRKNNLQRSFIGFAILLIVALYIYQQM